MDKKGFTLIEVIVVLGIISVIFAVGFQFFNFSLKTWILVDSESNIIRDTRVVTTYMDKEIREALKSTPGPAIEIENYGDLVRIYHHRDDTVVNSKDKIISYRVDENNVFQRVIYNEGETPDEVDWKTLFNNVKPVIKDGTIEPYFSLDGPSLHLQLRAYDDRREERPVTVENTFTVRSINGM